MKELLIGRFGYGLLGVNGPIIQTWRKFWWGMVIRTICHFKRHDWKHWDYGYVRGETCQRCRKTNLD